MEAILIPLGQCVVDHFKGSLSQARYWGKPYPQLWTIRENLRSGKYFIDDQGDIVVEYGWSDALVVLSEKDGRLVFENTICST